MSLNQQAEMNKKWFLTEKIIACLITLWGMYTLYGIVATIYGMISSGFVKSGNTTYLQILQTDHLGILLSLGCIFGGIFLFYSDKTGWLLTLICSSMFAISLFMSAAANRDNVKKTALFFYQSYSVTAILFVIILILLIQKPFREKYQPTAKNWRTAGLIFIVLLADKILI